MISGRFIFCRKGNVTGALPALIVSEKVDGKHYTKEEIRVRDDMTTGFTQDRSVLGKWKVCGCPQGMEFEADAAL